MHKRLEPPPSPAAPTEVCPSPPPAGRRRLGVACTALLLTAVGARAQDPAVLYIGGVALAAVVPGFVFDLPQPDAQRRFLRLSLGDFDAIDHENNALDLILEYQPGATWHRIKPLFGVAANTDGTIYGWVAASHDVHVRDSFVVKVMTGPAFYAMGDGAKSLGSPAVLRSGFEMGYRFAGEARLTASFHHMSHGNLLNPDSNPGTEVVALNLSLPIG